MRRELSGKRILITGASSGIGEALARDAARRGCRVVIAARSRDKLQALADELSKAGAEVLAVPTDVTKPDDRAKLFEEAVARFGGLDIVINNAGVAAHGHFVDLDSEILRKTFEVNFFAVAENCRLAIPVLANGQQPIIVNVSSMCGRRGMPAWTEYSASKFAVCGFSEALRAELVRFGIDLLLVVPGLTNSSFGDHLLARKGRMPAQFSHGLPTAEVARRILEAVIKNKHELRLERDARLVLLVNWLAPRFVDWRLGKLVARLYPKEIEELRARRPQPAP